MTPTKHILPAIACSLLLSSLQPSPAAAQPPEGRGRDRARTFLVLRLADALNLSDEKALQIGSILRQNDELRQQLRQQRSELETKIHAALDSKPVDDDALAKLVTSANDIDHQLALLPEKSFQDAQKILTVEQQARLILFRPELQNQVRRAIRRRFQGGRGREQQPGGPPPFSGPEDQP